MKFESDYTTCIELDLSGNETIQGWVGGGACGCGVYTGSSPQPIPSSSSTSSVASPLWYLA